MERETVVTLDTIGHGAALQMFNDEMSRVLDNVLDLNTTLAKRTITLKVEIKPKDDNREESEVKIDCTSKLAPFGGVETRIYHAKNAKGQIEVAEHDSRQIGLFENQDHVPAEDNVTPLRK